MRDLVDPHYTKAELIRVSWTISRRTPWEHCTSVPGVRGVCILQRIEFHNTPKHASWLNMVEIEIGVLRPVPGLPD